MVNDQKVGPEPRELHHGDQIRAGPTRLEFFSLAEALDHKDGKEQGAETDPVHDDHKSNDSKQNTSDESETAEKRLPWGILLPVPLVLAIVAVAVKWVWDVLGTD